AGYRSGQQDAAANRYDNQTRPPALTQPGGGYNPKYEFLSEYQESYRLGFADGYRDGYNGVAKKEVMGVPPALRYRPAFTRGYQEGHRDGRQDAQAQRPYDRYHQRGLIALLTQSFLVSRPRM